MTIEEIQAKKRLLETNIKQLILKFQAETHLYVEEINLSILSVDSISKNPRDKFLSDVEARVLI